MSTNFVIGARVGTNAVNALAILGTNVLSSTVWRIDDTPVTNGVSLADILCTNGVMRTPSRFALEWKSTTDVSKEADADGDGLTDWQEFAIFGTDPDQPDTDGDGFGDGDEIAADPLNHDENNDGVPDGIAPAVWASHPLWASNSVPCSCGLPSRSTMPSPMARTPPSW